jgi:hypothetical protein
MQKELAVYRKLTTKWSSSGSVNVKITLKKMKRISGMAWDQLACEIENVGGDAADRIINLLNVEDGLYELHPCNESTDWETGIVDDYDLELIPYVDKEAK